MAFSVEPHDAEVTSKIEELSGKLGSDFSEDKLMHSVMQADKKDVDNGQLIEESINQGLGSFTPDLMYEAIVKNYSMARKLYGETLLMLLTGYDPDYLKKNIKIPEFQRELKKRIGEKTSEMKKDGLLDKDFAATDRAIELSSLVVLLQELDKLLPKGFLGEKLHKKVSHYGERNEIREYRKGDRYKDMAIERSVKTAIRRCHSELLPGDLRTYSRKSKGKVCVIFALDASSSMKGGKLGICKRAGLTFAFNATQNKDEVGIIVFGSEVKKYIQPTTDFGLLMKEIMTIRATTQTNITETISKSIELFPQKKITKHLILITDTKPNVGNKPEDELLAEVSKARSVGITVSLVGIGLDKEGKDLSRRIVELGEGRLYSIKNLEDVGTVVLEDYYSVV